VEAAPSGRTRVRVVAEEGHQRWSCMLMERAPMGAHRMERGIEGGAPAMVVRADGEDSRRPDGRGRRWNGEGRRQQRAVGGGVKVGGGAERGSDEC
jgi:hypothetical protein